MSAALHLAGPDAADRLLPMVRACHAEAGLAGDDAQRGMALQPLLDGSPLGCVWTIGPKAAPIGYVVISFGWSVAHGGLAAALDELFVRPGVRGRGIGSEVLAALLPRLEASGVRATTLAAAADGPGPAGLYRRAGFRSRSGHAAMIRLAGAAI